MITALEGRYSLSFLKGRLWMAQTPGGSGIDIRREQHLYNKKMAMVSILPDGIYEKNK
jgi:hypothetical protein